MGIKPENIGPKWKLHRQYVSHAILMNSMLHIA